MSDDLENVDGQYLMTTRVHNDDKGDISPYKSVKFDASHLLKQSRYIKSNDTQLIDLEFIPIKEIDFSITIPIKEGANIYKLPILHRMTNQEFYREFKDKLQWEYLYSRFSFGNTEKPNIDYFRFSFPFENKVYEIVLRREEYNDDYSYMGTEGIQEKGYYDDPRF